MKLFLALPSLDGKLTIDCSESIRKNVENMKKEGHEVIVYQHSGDCFIGRARSFCTKLFLESKFDNLIFIDSDIGFEEDAIQKLIKYDKEIVAGAYRFKHEKEEYPVHIKFDPITGNCKDEETGLVSAWSVPTGFMNIKRIVFDKMIDHYKMKSDKEGIYYFFEDGMIFPENDWYGEDASFCRKWIEMGGELWIEPRLNLDHTGTFKFKGNYHEYLLGRRVNKLDEVKEGIPGWMTNNELSILKYLASKSKDVVEIGSWKGRSTKELLESCRGTVFAIDKWDNDTGNFKLDVMSLTQNIYDEFISNVGNYSKLKIMKGASLDMVCQFNGNKVDMIFIDGDHSYESCKADIEAWKPKCNKIICGHDYSIGFPGVVQAVNEKFDKINKIDSFWFVEI